MKWTRTRAASALALGTASVLLLAACSSGTNPTSSDTGTPTTAPTTTTVETGDPVVITFGYWGNFGVSEDRTGWSLKGQYTAMRPYVDLQLTAGDYNAQHELLKQALLAGSGAYTVSAVDEGFITGFVAQADKFVNLLDLGAAEYEDRYLPWKWGQASNADGSVVIGLGSDVGGLALCYRQDLFEAAGVVSDRDGVSAAVGASWDDFITFGEDYVAKSGAKFVDNATNILNPALSQIGLGYYNRNNELDMDAVKPAFDIALAVNDAGLSANIAAWSPEWNAGFRDGAFAVLPCPAWMLGYIQSQIPEDEFDGQWDIADIPGDGGNWGGSFYTIPKQGTEYEQAEAYKFIQWLIEPAQQIKIMEETGNLPSQKTILESDAVTQFTNPFFNDAPYGEIFAKTVLDIPEAIYYAPNNGAIRQAVEAVLNDVQSGKTPSADAWAAAVAAAEAKDV